MPLNRIDSLVKLSKAIAILAALVVATALFAGIFRFQVAERNGVFRSRDIGSVAVATDQSAGSALGIMGAEPQPMMEKVASEVAPDSVMMAGGIDTGETINVEERRVVRDGTLSLRVEDTEWSADEIGRIAERFGGFVVSRVMSSEIPGYPMPMMRGEFDNSSDEEPSVGTSIPESGMITIKVPSEKFAETMSAIRGIATAVLNESSSASDVTAAYVDLEAQLKNKYAEEEAFTKILNTNAQKVSDILEVTRELSRVRGEIERLEAQKKYMDSQTDMASITVSLSEDARVGSVSNDWRPWQTVKNAVNQLLLHFRGFIDGSIYFVVSVLPLFLLYLIGLYVLFLVGRMIYRKLVEPRRE